MEVHERALGFTFMYKQVLPQSFPHRDLVKDQQVKDKSRRHEERKRSTNAIAL